MNENLDKHQVGNFDLVNQLAKSGHKQIETKDDAGLPEYEVGNNHLANLHAGYDAVVTKEALNLTHHPVDSENAVELTINEVDCKILWMQGERTAIEVPTHLAQRFIDEWNATLQPQQSNEPEIESVQEIEVVEESAIETTPEIEVVEENEIYASIPEDYNENDNLEPNMVVQEENVVDELPQSETKQKKNNRK
jgi:hypothetical protein